MSGGGNIVWLGLGLIGVVLLAPNLRSGGASAPVVTSPATSAPGKPVGNGSPASPLPAAGNGYASRTIDRAPDGHFYLDAQVNGAPVHFLIDTGASMVALTSDDAQRAGISLPSERAMAQGAGGAIEVIPVTIDRIAAGPLEARNIEGAVGRDLPISLLGQSFLERVGRVEIDGDRMTLR